jgi:hypothetical protein
MSNSAMLIVAVYGCVRVSCRLSCIVIYADATYLFFLSSYRILAAEYNSYKFVILDCMRLAFSRVAATDSVRLKQPDFQHLLLLGKIIW